MSTFTHGVALHDRRCHAISAEAVAGSTGVLPCPSLASDAGGMSLPTLRRRASGAATVRLAMLAQLCVRTPSGHASSLEPLSALSATRRAAFSFRGEVRLLPRLASECSSRRATCRFLLDHHDAPGSSIASNSSVLRSIASKAGSGASSGGWPRAGPRRAQMTSSASCARASHLTSFLCLSGLRVGSYFPTTTFSTFCSPPPSSYTSYLPCLASARRRRS